MKENEILSRRNVDSTNRCCHCMFSPAGQSRSPTVEPSSFSVTVAPQKSRHLRSEAAQARLIFLHVKVYVSSRTDMHRSAHGPLWVHFTTDAPSVWAGTPKPLLNKTAWLHRWIPFIECTGVLFFFYNIGIFEGFEMHSGIEAMQTCLSRAAKPTRWCHLYNLMKIWASVDIAAAGGMSSHCHHNLPRGRGEGGCISPSSSTIYIKTFMMFQRKNVLGAIVRGQWWGNESIDTKYKYSENGNWQYSRFRIT